jgi:mannosyltransferase
MPHIVCQSWFQRIVRPEHRLTDPSDRFVRWSVVIISLMAFTLRLIQLGAESIWFDEGFSIRMATLPLGELLPAIRREDFNPPLYYLILHGWIRWFGDSEWVLRLFAVLCGTLSIPLAYRLGKDLLGKTAALWAAFLMAVSVYHIYFSQQVRGYALFALLTWISMILFFRLLERPSVRVVFGYCGVTILALYCHPFGMIHVLAQNVMFGFLFLRESAIRKRWILWLGMQGILAIAFSPWVSATLRISRRVVRMHEQTPIYYMSIWDLPGALKALAGDADFLGSWAGERYWVGGLFILLSLVALVHAGVSRMISRKRSTSPKPDPPLVSIRSNGLGLTLTWLLTVLLVPFAVSHLAVPMFSSRYMVSIILPFFLLVGMGVSVIPWRFLGYAGGLSVVCASVTTLVPYYTHVDNIPWRDIAGYVESRAKPGDLLVFHAPYCNPSVYWYYAKRKDLVRVGFPSSGDPASMYPQAIREELTPLVEPYRRVWLILSHSFDPNNLILSYLDQSFRCTDQRTFYRAEVSLHERTAAESTPQNMSAP